MQEKNKFIEAYDPETDELFEVPVENASKLDSARLVPTTPQIKKEIEARKFAKDSPLAPLAATGAAIARGLSLNLSDVAATKLGIVAPETLKALDDEYEELSTGAEIVASAAPVLATGGSGLIAKALTKTPAGLVEKLGSRVTSKVGAALGADQIAKAGTKNIIKEITKKGAALGVGGAVEGAAYGVGDLIGENALGNADLSAENLIKSVGYGAALGGSLGFGLGASGKAITKSVDSALNFKKDKAGKDYIRSLDLPDVEKEGLLKQYEQTGSLKELFGDDFVSIKQGLVKGIGDEKLEQDLIGKVAGDSYSDKAAFTSLMKSPTKEGTIFQEEVADLSNRVLDNAEKIVSGDVKSLDSAGKDLVQNLGGKFKANKELASLQYEDGLKPLEGIPVTRKEFTNFYKKFVDNQLSAQPVAVKDVVRKELDDIANRVTDLKSAYQISKDLKQAARGIQDYNTKNAYYSLARSLQFDLVENSVKKLGLQGKQYAGIAQEAFDKIKAADKFYAETSKEIQKFTNIMGGRKDKSIASIDGWIDDFDSFTKDPADIAKKLYNEYNVDFIKYLAKDHPDVFGSWKNLQKYKALEQGMTTKDYQQVFDPRKAFGHIQSTIRKNPELADLVYSKKEIKQIKKLADVYGRLKTDINPSGTAYANRFLELGKTVAEILGNVATGNLAGAVLNTLGAFKGIGLQKTTDKVAKAILKGDLKWIDDIAGERVRALTKVVDNDISQERKIKRSASGFVKSLEKASNFSRSGLIRGAVNVIPYSNDELEKSEEVYRDLQRDPMKLIESFQERNPELNETLPDVSNAASQVITRAVEYLQTKIPPQRSDYFMDEYNPSRSEIFKFAEYSEAIFDPDKVMDRMKSGYVSPRQLEAMEVVYPETVAKLRESIIEFLPKANLSEKGKNFISLVLGVQTKPSLEPANIQSLQSSFEVINQKEMGQAPQKSAKKIKLNDNIYKQVSSESDKALYRRSLS